MKRLFFTICRQWPAAAACLLPGLFCLAYSAVADTLTVTLTGTGAGSVNSDPAGIACTTSTSPCSASFANMSGVTLIATPDWKSKAGVFSGGCIGTGSCFFNISSNTGVTATFEPIYRVGVSHNIVPTYATITDAYAAVATGSTLWTTVDTFIEDVSLNRNIFIRLSGGTDGGLPVSGSATTLQGTLNANDGSVEINNFIVRDLVVSGGSVDVLFLTVQ